MIDPNQEPLELLLMYLDCYFFNDCTFITANFLAVGEPAQVSRVSINRLAEVCGHEAVFVEACGWSVWSWSMPQSLCNYWQRLSESICISMLRVQVMKARGICIVLSS